MVPDRIGIPWGQKALSRSFTVAFVQKLKDSRTLGVGSEMEARTNSQLENDQSFPGKISSAGQPSSKRKSRVFTISLSEETSSSGHDCLERGERGSLDWQSEQSSGFCSGWKAHIILSLSGR
ncbi:hypothetical protein VTO42DRAFT_7250 [Malbranchea cinnamomea]